eukprot:5549527-Alexandrium_andersonii.AAC.1
MLSRGGRRRRRASRGGGSGFLQIPSRGEGCLAHRASRDRDLPGWILGTGPILTRGLSDRALA